MSESWEGKARAALRAHDRYDYMREGEECLDDILDALAPIFAEMEGELALLREGLDKALGMWSARGAEIERLQTTHVLVDRETLRSALRETFADILGGRILLGPRLMDEIEAGPLADALVQRLLDAIADRDPGGSCDERGERGFDPQPAPWVDEHLDATTGQTFLGSVAEEAKARGEAIDAGVIARLDGVLSVVAAFDDRVKALEEEALQALSDRRHLANVMQGLQASHCWDTQCTVSLMPGHGKSVSCPGGQG